MKQYKTKLSFLSYFLCSTVSFAMEPVDSENQYKVLNILQVNDGKPTRIRVSKAQPGNTILDALDVNVEQMQFLSYEHLFPAQDVYDALDPKQSIPADIDLGSTSKKFLLSFQDGNLKGNCEWTDQRTGKVLKHGGCWFSDPDTDATTRILKFNYKDNGRDIWFSPTTPVVREIAVTQVEGTARIVGNLHFDGRKLEEEIRAVTPSIGTAATTLQPIPGHDGYQTKLAIPFAIDGHLFSGRAGDFVGDYKILGKTINPHINANRVIYVSNRSFYWPKVTHELCERGHGQNKQRVGFTVISIKDSHKAGPIIGLQNAAQLPDGAYILKSVRKVEIPNEIPQFEETWEELRADSMILPQNGGNATFTKPNTFTRIVDEKLASFPGIGARRFQVDAGAGDVAKMQDTIEKMDQNILSISLKHPDANSLLLVGYSGSGKSVLINLLLGGEQNLQVQKISGGRRIGAHKEYSKIGHERKRGTGIPQGFWVSDYDPNIGSNIAIWDLCGLGDPAGTFADIPIAYNLRRLFSNIGDGNVKISLVTEQVKLTERDNKKGFLPLLNDLSKVFPNFDELKQIVSSLVVSRYDGNDDIVEVLKGILEEQQREDEKVQNGEQREITELSANARLLVQYLIDEENKQAGSRIIHFPGTAGMRDGSPYSAGGQVREAFLEAYKNTKGNVRPNVDALKVVRNSSDALKLAASINNSVAKYIGTQGTDSLFRLARSKVIENVQSVKKLKEVLVDTKNNLTKIRDLSKTPEKFLKKLSKLFGGDRVF